MKVTEQYSPVVVFIILCKVVRTFESMDEILKCATIQMKAIEQHFWYCRCQWSHLLNLWVEKNVGCQIDIPIRSRAVLLIIFYQVDLRFE